jgi:hypothetical protein
MPLEEAGFWRSEAEWPITRAVPTKLYFHGDGKLGREPSTGPDEAADSYDYKPTVGITSGMHWGGGILPWAMPVDQRPDEAYSLTYTTSPLEEDVEVSGAPRALLHVSSTAEVAYFRVKLIDVAPDGTSKLVRYGGLSGTHRNSHFEPEAMVPGEIYELAVDVKEMSYVFAAGHRIRVAIAGADIQNAWPTPEPAVSTLHRSRRHPSHILLPVIPEQSPKLPKPDLVELPTADPKLLNTPLEYSITHDLVGKAVTLRLGRETKGVRGEGSERMVTRSRFTVSEENPAAAVLAATSTYVVERPDSEVVVKANEVTSSDEAAFHHVVGVEVTVNGARHFQKSWSVTVPRKLN